MTTDPNLNQTIKDYIDNQLEDKVKKIQIAYLKENFLTRDEFLDSMNRMDKRFEAMDRRFEAVQKQMDERFEAMQKQMDRRFERVYERLENMDLGYAQIVEGLGYSVVKREFRQRGFDLDIQFRQHFTDENKEVNPDTTDVEIDLYYKNPNIIGEASLKITEVDKIRTFIRKINFIEKWFNEPFKRYFITFKIDERINTEVEKLLQQYKIELIIPKIK